MKGIRVYVSASLIVGLSVIVAPRAEAALPEEAPSCGSSVDHSFRLNADVGPCTGTWITLTEPDLVIDLGGHTVMGNGTNDFVGTGETAVDSNFNLRPTVRNGIVRDFEQGVRLLGSGARVTDLVSLSNHLELGIGIFAGPRATITNSVANLNFVGIDVDDNSVISSSEASFNLDEGVVPGAGSRVVGSVINENDDFGISVTGAGVVVSGNSVTFNGQRGMIINGDDAIIKNNQILDNGVVGVDITSNRAIITGNAISRGPGVGMNGFGNRATISGNTFDVNATGLLWQGSNVTISGNRARSNTEDGIIASGSPVLVANNRANGNALNGITVQGAGPRIRENIANGNGVHGIRDEATGAVIRENITKANGFAPDDGTGLGIDASSDATVRGGANIARANDDTRQCDPAFLC